MSDVKVNVFAAYFNGPEDDACPGCGAEWVANVRDHTGTCSYLAWQSAADTF